MDEAYEVAKPYIEGMSKEEFMGELTTVAKQSGQVSEEELSNVSGGAGEGVLGWVQKTLKDLGKSAAHKVIDLI